MLTSGEMHCRAIQRGGNSNAGSANNSTILQWSKTVHVYLFDQSIILCKKDVLKKNCLIFKERMSLQSTSVQDLNDGKGKLYFYYYYFYYINIIKKFEKNVIFFFWFVW